MGTEGSVNCPSAADKIRVRILEWDPTASVLRDTNNGTHIIRMAMNNRTLEEIKCVLTSFGLSLERMGHNEIEFADPNSGRMSVTIWQLMEATVIVDIVCLTAGIEEVPRI